MSKFFEIIKEPGRILAFVWSRLFFWVSDSLYLKVRFRLLMGYRLNLINPKAFNEKLNWLKLYDRNPLYHELVDKASVKDFVKKRIGEEYIIPTYGVWDNFDDIDFSVLPDKFVLKSTNGGGGNGVIICKDKSVLDIKQVKERLEASAKSNWHVGLEWVYSNLKPRYIAEAILENKDGSDLVDYKFHCFNGEPRLLFLASDRYKGENTLKFDWYDMNLRRLPFNSKGYSTSNREIKLFPEFEKMKDIARTLAKDIPNVRVDLYLVNGQIYFGEMTFYHDAGFVALEPFEWELKLGELLQLPKIN